MTTTDQLFEEYYFSRPGFTNGTVRFHNVCSAFLPKDANILEIGAGPSNATSRFLGSRYKVTGLDVSDEVVSNEALLNALTYDGNVFPIEDKAYDGVVSNYVLEHVTEPLGHFCEVARVLRVGGVYCFRTPNLFHYVTAVSALTPHCFHQLVANRLRRFGADEHEPWPTCYRANTVKKVRRLAQASGLSIAHVETVEAEPVYGRRSPILFYPMMVYERLVNSCGALSTCRSNIFAVLQKR